jgi:uncharacterized repeat protein (TIGR03803 family)
MKQLLLLLKITWAAAMLAFAITAKSQSVSEQLVWTNDGTTSSAINTYNIATGMWKQPYQFVAGNDNSLGTLVRDVAYSATTNLYYVISSDGGFNNQGTLLTFNASTKKFTKLLDFGGAKGSTPKVITLDTDGTLYGVTSAGGAYGKGIFFSYNFSSQQFITLMDLSISPEGSTYLRLWKSSTGVFYASTSNNYDNSAMAIIQFNLQTKGTTLYPIAAVGDYGQTRGNNLIENAGTFYYLLAAPSTNDGKQHLKSWRPGQAAQTLYAFDFDGVDISPGIGLALLNNTLVGSYQSLTGNTKQIWEFDLSTKKLTPRTVLDGDFEQAFSSNGYVYGFTSNSTLVQYDVASHTIKSKRSLSISALSTFNRMGLTVNSKFYGSPNTSGNLWIEGTPGPDDYGGFIPQLDPTNTYVDRGGSSPNSNIFQGYNGKFYGRTNVGGRHNQGVLYEFDPVTNQYLVKINFTEKNNYYPMMLSSDGHNIYGAVLNSLGNDSLLVKYDIITNTFNNTWRYSPPNPALTGNYAPSTLSDGSLTKISGGSSDVLYWLSTFAGYTGNNADSKRWILESYNVATGVRTTYVPTGLVGVTNVYTTEKTNVAEAKRIDSLYRTTAGVNPQMAVSNGKIYISTYKFKRTFTTKTRLDDDGIPYTYVEITEVPLGNPLHVFDPANGAFSTTIANLSDYNTTPPVLADVNGTLFAQVVGNPQAATTQRKPGLYQVNLTAKNLVTIWNPDSLKNYSFPAPVAGNTNVWSASSYEVGSNLVKYDQTANRSTSTFFADDRFASASHLLWLPAAPVAQVTANTVTTSGFTVSWAAVGGAVSYAVDVSTDNFTTFVAGYEAKAVTATSLAVTGLAANTAYQVRVRAVAQETRSLPSSTVTATTLKQNQTITWATIPDPNPNIPPPTVGGTLALNATASSGLAVTYTTTTAAKLTLAGNQATWVQAGPASITASQTGNATYSAANPVTQTFCINPATPTVTVTGNNTATPSLRSGVSTGNQWYLNGTAISNATGQTYNVPVSGTYTVKVTVEGCTSAPSANQVITVVSPKIEPTLTWATPAAITYGTPLGNAQLNATAAVGSTVVAGTFAYSPAWRTVLNAGNQLLTVVFTPTDLTRYQAAQKSVTLTVAKAVPTLQWATPASVPVGTQLDNAQLNATAISVVDNTTPLNGTFTYQPARGTVLAQAGTTTLRVDFQPSGADATNYVAASKEITLVVDKRTPILNWPAPAAIPYGTALTDVHLNATADVDGSFSYTPAKGTVLNVGTQTLQATFTPTDAANYATATASTTLQVTKASQSITFNAIAPKAVGDADFALQATASSGLPVVFEYPANKLQLTGTTAKLVSAGFVTVVAKQAGNENYEAAAPVSKSFCIAPAKPVITLSNSGSDKITLTSSAAVGNQWYRNDALIDQATGTTLTVTAPGAYKVQATVDVCSSAFSDNQAVVVTGDLTPAAVPLQLYPNPADRQLTVRFPSDGTVTTVTVYDVTGRLVDTQTVQGKEAQFLVTNYPAGLYVIKVQQAQGVTTARFEKK